MCRGLLLVAATAIGMGLGTGAEAADRAYCDQYAKATLNQVRIVLSNQKCTAGAQGQRWSAEYHVHYDWCLENSYGTSGTERDSRTAYIKSCTGQ